MAKDFRVLVVDDNADNRDLYCLAMELEGFEARGARTVSECLELVFAFRPSVLVCDLRLPDGNGYGLIRRIRGDGYRMPAIALTSLATASREASLDAGYSEHCVKPMAPDDLIAVIGRLAGPAV